MAYIVGTLLVLLICVCVPLKYLATDGTDIQQLGQQGTTVLGIAHGYLYMIFLVSAAMLARHARWNISFTVTTLLAGTIPFVSFWAEHRAQRAVRDQYRQYWTESSTGGSADAPSDSTATGSDQ